MMTKTVWRRLGNHKGVLVAVHLPAPERRHKLVKLAFPKPPKPVKPTSEQIFFKLEMTVGAYFPDGDPADYIAPWLEAKGLKWEDADRAVRKHAGGRRKKRGYGFYDWLADMWEETAADQIHDARALVQAGHVKRLERYGAFYRVKSDNTIEPLPNPWRSA